MGGVFLELTVVLVLVGMNGVLAASEIAVVTSRKSRLRARANQGDHKSQVALSLANEPNRFLSTVQIGITAIAVIAGAFGGARVAGTLTPVLVSAGIPAEVAHEVAIVLIVSAITYVTLVIGELVPKRIALQDPERVAARLAEPMRLLAWIATPLVHVLARSTEMILRLVPRSDRVQDDTIEDEIRSMIARATEVGTLEVTEQQIVDRLFRLSDTNLGMLMTPRDAIVWLDRRSGPDAWRRQLRDVRHTRYIVADGDLDRHVGYVKVQEWIERLMEGGDLVTDPPLRKPHVLPAWTPAFQLLELFQRSGDHIALVTGDDGRIAGLVTLNDLLEGLVGTFPDMVEAMAPGMVQRADGSWLVDGLIPFDQFVEAFELEETGIPHFSSLHAFIIEHLEAPPRAATVFIWQGLRIEIVDTDGSRVDKVLVSDAPNSDADGRPGPRE